MFANRAKLLQCLSAEMKGVNLEKFKGSFPHCQPPLLFVFAFFTCLSASLLISSVLSTLSFISTLFFKTLTALLFICPYIFLLVSCWLSVTSGLKRSGLQAENFTRQAFPSHTATWWGV